MGCVSCLHDSSPSSGCENMCVCAFVSVFVCASVRVFVRVFACSHTDACSSIHSLRGFLVISSMLLAPHPMFLCAFLSVSHYVESHHQGGLSVSVGKCACRCVSVCSNPESTSPRRAWPRVARVVLVDLYACVTCVPSNRHTPSDGLVLGAFAKTNKQKMLVRDPRRPCAASSHRLPPQSPPPRSTSPVRIADAISSVFSNVDHPST